MQNLRALPVFCLLALSCGQVTPINTDGGGSGGTGTGGASASGGASGSGGATGTGGATGSGGATGTGGTVVDASTDHPATDAGDTCSGLQAQYEAAFKEARSCNPMLSAPQCQATASESLPCPNCVTHVQTTATLDQIRMKWTDQGCHGSVCPLIACRLPGAGGCMAVDGGDGTAGVCFDQPIVTTQ